MRLQDQSVSRRGIRLLLSGSLVFEQRTMLFTDVFQKDLLLISLSVACRERKTTTDLF